MDLLQGSRSQICIGLHFNLLTSNKCDLGNKINIVKKEKDKVSEKCANHGGEWCWWWVVTVKPRASAAWLQLSEDDWRAQVYAGWQRRWCLSAGLLSGGGEGEVRG